LKIAEIFEKKNNPNGFYVVYDHLGTNIDINLNLSTISDPEKGLLGSYQECQNYSFVAGNLERKNKRRRNL
jgi:hypothetical protein